MANFLGKRLRKIEVKMDIKVLTVSAFLFVMVLFPSYVFYRKVTNKSVCSDSVITDFKNGKTHGTPYRVVIQPWNGRHNVYAVFMLPKGVKPRGSLLVKIPNVGMYCGRTQRLGSSYEGIQAKPGYYLMKANLKTRTSALLIARGYLNQLKDPNNWNLI